MTQETTFSSRGRMSHAAWRHGGRLALVLLAALVAAASPARSDAASTDGRVVLQECLLSGVNFPAEHEHVAQYVPPGYPLGTYGDAGVVAIWVFSCKGANAAGDLGSADLSVVGVLLHPDANLADPTTWPNALAPSAAADQQWAANWPQYVVWAHTDNAELAAALRRTGMPVSVVQGISLREQYKLEPVEQRVDLPDTHTCSRIGPLPGAGHSPPDDVRAPEPPKSTEVTVPWARSPYETSTVLPLSPHNTVTHCHDQLFWHGPVDSASAVHISIPAARDHFCSHPEPGCGRAEAEPASAVAGFLGSPVRTDPVLAFDHERIPEVLIAPR